MARHFLHISDFEANDIREILQLATKLKAKFHARDDYRPFTGQTLAMIFAKPSARTRVSFETGFTWMGGHALFLGPQDIGIGKREFMAQERGHSLNVMRAIKNALDPNGIMNPGKVLPVEA